jgi:monoamine oxidase
MARKLWHVAKAAKTPHTGAMMETGVAIIGGGAAGIAAAKHLTEAGVPCLIVEARERLGGRAFTQTIAGHPLDLGCGWLHSADDNHWARIAELEGKIVDKTPPPWMRPALQPGFPLEKQRAFREASTAFFERLDAGAFSGDDRPASDFLEPGGRFNALIASLCTYISGDEPDKLSAQDFARYADTEVNWRVVQGYGTVIVEHAQGLHTTLGTPVTRIDHSGKRLRIETAKGAIAAAQAIITLPSDLIAENEDLFAPVLPDKVEAARGLPLGLADKLFVALDDADQFQPDTRLFGALDRVGTATYHVRPFGRPMIECYFGGGNARALEAEGERAFFDFASGQLTALLGASFAKRIKPLGMHLWGTDPYAHGSYSYAVPGKADERARLAAPVDGRLFFAGEACSPGYFTTAHGAYETGIKAADAVLDARKNHN